MDTNFNMYQILHIPDKQPYPLHHQPTGQSLSSNPWIIIIWVRYMVITDLKFLHRECFGFYHWPKACQPYYKVSSSSPIKNFKAFFNSRCIWFIMQPIWTLTLAAPPFLYIMVFLKIVENTTFFFEYCFHSSTKKKLTQWHFTSFVSLVISQTS